MTPMQALIRSVDEIVHQDRHPEAGVATALARSLGEPDLVPTRHRHSSPDHYRANVVHVAADASFSIVAVVWRPGHITPIHSHRSWCVVGVHEGEECETSYDLQPGGGITGPVAARRYRSGDVTWLESVGDVHQVENCGSTVAISLHVYGLDYRQTDSSILDVYEPPVRLSSSA